MTSRRWRAATTGGTPPPQSGVLGRHIHTPGRCPNRRGKAAYSTSSSTATAPSSSCCQPRRQTRVPSSPTSIAGCPVSRMSSSWKCAPIWTRPWWPTRCSATKSTPAPEEVSSSAQFSARCSRSSEAVKCHQSVEDSLARDGQLTDVSSGSAPDYGFGSRTERCTKAKR
jgi:hypothetical protein